MSDFPTIIYETDGPVAHISLNRPRQRNAYNVQMRDDLAETLGLAAADPVVRALLITGQGPVFCAGADLTEFGSAPSQVIARRVRWERDVWGQLINLDKPIVAAVHGHCIGSGVELLALADLRLTAAGTQFAMPEVHIGLIPAAGGTQTLPRNVGAPAALDWLLTGRRFDAVEALRRGLVTRVLPPAELLPAARRLAQELATLNPSAVAALKQALRQGADLPLPDALAVEARLATFIGG